MRFEPEPTTPGADPRDRCKRLVLETEGDDEQRVLGGLVSILRNGGRIILVNTLEPPGITDWEIKNPPEALPSTINPASLPFRQ